MLGTSIATKGGIASVLQVYRDTGLLQRCCVSLIATHRDGSAALKLVVAVRAFAVVLFRLLFDRPALVHLHVSSRASFWRKSVFMAMATVFRVPYLLHLHGSEFQVFHGEECGPIRRRTVRWFFDRADLVLVLSEQWRVWVQSMCTNSRVEVLYNPVIVPPPVPWSKRREAFTVLFLGRLGTRKGTYELIQAFANACHDDPSARLLLGGDGDLEGARTMAAELGVGVQVELLGWVDASRRGELLDSASVYALPSFHEGLPMSILEAMAHGLPIVTTPVGGIPEAVEDGVEGLLVRPGDVDALCGALRRLHDEPALRARMGTAAREKVVQLFSAETTLPVLENHYAAFQDVSRPASSIGAGGCDSRT
jgi:glycosyltransferase involved in cell wall biosynthesis